MKQNVDTLGCLYVYRYIVGIILLHRRQCNVYCIPPEHSGLLLIKMCYVCVTGVSRCFSQFQLLLEWQR